jgi:hypothetical protein
LYYLRNLAGKAARLKERKVNLAAVNAGNAPEAKAE